eukprot:scaffold15964_cov135-Isochrysis_galbana.AAC.3
MTSTRVCAPHPCAAETRLLRPTSPPRSFDARSHRQATRPRRHGEVTALCACRPCPAETGGASGGPGRRGSRARPAAGSASNAVPIPDVPKAPPAPGPTLTGCGWHGRPPQVALRGWVHAQRPIPGYQVETCSPHRYCLRLHYGRHLRLAMQSWMRRQHRQQPPWRGRSLKQ